MKRSSRAAERGMVVTTKGCDQGTELPPELRPRRSRTRVETRVVAPRKSMRFRRAVVEAVGSLTGMWTVRKTTRPERAERGTWM